MISKLTKYDIARLRIAVDEAFKSEKKRIADDYEGQTAQLIDACAESIKGNAMCHYHKSEADWDWDVFKSECARCVSDCATRCQLAVNQCNSKVRHIDSLRDATLAVLDGRDCDV